jgi:hypothetical protein
MLSMRWIYYGGISYRSGNSQHAVYRVGRLPALPPQTRSVVHSSFGHPHVFGSILFELSLSSFTHFLQSTWWTRSLEIGCLHAALLLMYVASEQLLNDRPYLPLMKHRLVPLMLLFIACGAAIGALGEQNLGAFLVDPAFRPTPLYTISYFWNYGLQFCFVVLTLKLYIQSLGRYAVLTYLTRRLICIASFSFAACALCAAEINLLLFLFGEKSWHFSLSQITLVGETLALWLLVAGFTIPQDVMERIIQPLEDSLAWRKWLQHDLLYALHQRMIQIVPCVHLPYPRDAQRDASNESIGFTGCLPALARRVAATFTGVQDHHDPALKTSPEPLHVRVNLVAHPVGFWGKSDFPCGHRTVPSGWSAKSVPV